MLTAFARPLKFKIKQLGLPYSFEHLVLLKIIKDKKDTLAQQDIAERLGKDKSVIMRIVDILEKDNLLIRKVDPNDRRRNILEVTPEGDMLIKNLLDIEVEISGKLMQDIPDDEIAVFLKVIAQLKLNAENLYSEISKNSGEPKQ